MEMLPWLKAFVLTLVIECPVAVWFFRHREPSRLHLVVLPVFANLATHPVAWFVFPSLPMGGWTNWVLAEVWASGTEAVFFALTFRGVSWLRAGVVALGANALSAGVGLALYWWGPEWLLA